MALEKGPESLQLQKIPPREFNWGASKDRKKVEKHIWARSETGWRQYMDEKLARRKGLEFGASIFKSTG